MHAPVSITEAARVLGVERSTLSRYISRHAEALKPQKLGRDTLVDLEALKAHRGENIRLDQVQVTPAGEATRPRFQGTRSDEVALKTKAQRQLHELELAKQLNAVVPRQEVEDAALYAVTALRNAFDLALDESAQAIAQAARIEPRIVRPLLRRLVNQGLEAFTRQLTERSLQAAAPPEQ